MIGELIVMKFVEKKGWGAGLKFWLVNMGINLAFTLVALPLFLSTKMESLMSYVVGLAVSLGSMYITLKFVMKYQQNRIAGVMIKTYLINLAISVLIAMFVAALIGGVVMALILGGGAVVPTG
jgi:hypothetical protein